MISSSPDLIAELHEYEDHAALVEDYVERGWTDGLPIVAPEPRLVLEFLDVVGRSPGEVIGEVPTRSVVVTAEHVAINAVMAGCRPQYMPVVLAAVEALLDPRGHCHSTTASLAGPPHVVLVNGPIASALGVNAGLGCFGPGWRANATIGRALRLLIRNVCQAIPGGLDRATFSNPGRYSFCFAEDEESETSIPLHVERGMRAGSSAVTVFASWGQLPLWANVDSPEELADAIAAEICHHGNYSSEFHGGRTNLMVVLPRAHQIVVSRAGWSKSDLRARIWEGTAEARARVDFSHGFPAGFVPGRVTLQHEDDILIVFAGGDGLPECWLIFPHSGLAVTREVIDREEPA